MLKLAPLDSGPVLVAFVLAGATPTHGDLKQNRGIGNLPIPNYYQVHYVVTQYYLWPIVMLFLTDLTPFTLRATVVARAVQRLALATPVSVTTPLLTSALISRFCVLGSALRAFLSLIHISEPTRRTPI